MDDNTFRKYLLDKYGSEEALEDIHHYETTAFEDGYLRTIIPDGLVVDSAFNASALDQRLGQEVKYNDNIELRTENSTIDLVGTVKDANGNIVLGKGIRPVTNYKYEFDENEMKKNIIILKPEFLGVFVDDMKKIMAYSPSSQYVNKNTKRTYNPRLTGI